MDTPAERALEALKRFRGHGIDHLLMKARIRLGGIDAALDQDFRIVQIDRFIIDLVAAVVIDHGKLLADRSGCELLVIRRSGSSASTSDTRRRAVGSGSGPRSNTCRMCLSSRKWIGRRQKRKDHTISIMPECDRACPVNQTPTTPWEPTYENGLKFHDSKFRSQITRMVPLTDETKDMNRQFQEILGNAVWKNYMLLSTQWPSDFGVPKKDESSTPMPHSH